VVFAKPRPTVLIALAIGTEDGCVFDRILSPEDEEGERFDDAGV
jgi:hypothetical protein